MKLQKKKNKWVGNCFCTMMISLLVLSFSTYAAEYIYISDNLRVGVRTDPVSGEPPISVVITGMRLEVLEEVEGYVKIKTDEGVTGWIKDIYVTKKAPAIIQLNALQAEYVKLEKELSQRSDSSSMLEKANMALNEQINQLKEERQEWSRERASLMASQYKDSSWFWVVEIIILIIVSFLAGVLWHRAKVMKRFGGLRV